MVRSLTLALGAALAGAVSAQDAAGVKASLSVPRSVVTANGNVEFRLLLDVTADAELPATVMTGAAFEVRVGDKPGANIEIAGKGGAVQVVAGTKIERTISLPASRFVSGDGSGFQTVAVTWPGLPGANCVFKVTPDCSKIDLATLDMAKTKVVLVTNHGEMTLSFLPEKAPKHVENFLKLCQSGFYDGTKFHRVIRNFMIQGGDPNTKDDSKQAMWGQGGPGWSVNAEFNDTRHVRGVLSMARSQDPNSAGSQFFIVHKESSHLDGQYTAFGNLESGADTLDSIANTPVGARDMPQQPVVLYAAVILPVFK